MLMKKEQCRKEKRSKRFSHEDNEEMKEIVLVEKYKGWFKEERKRKEEQEK